LLQKFLFTITTLLFSYQTLVAQSELQNLAYLAYAKANSGVPYLGVGFFIKSKKNFYFLTAKHVVSIPSDTLTVLVCDTCLEPNRTIKIDISKASRTFNPIFGDTDIYIKKIDKKLAKRIYSIEAFVVKDYKKFDFKKIENIFIYGFPDTSNNFTFDLTNTFPKKIMTKASIIGSYDLVRYSTTLNRYDSINYWAKAVDDTFASEGDSGSPVFFKINNHFYFGGMCVSGVHTLNVISIVRPEKLIQFLLKNKY
jgi:hypothetical protein